MLFSTEQMYELYNAYYRKEELCITAFNSLGQEFTVVGKIAPFWGSEMPELEKESNKIYVGIWNNGLILDCGSEAQKNGEIRSPYCALLNTIDEQVDGEYVQTKYSIKSVASNQTKRVIFYDSNYEEFMLSNQLNNMKDTNSLLKQGRIPAAMDPDGKRLNQYIGQPIKINGEAGLLYSVEEVVPNGDLVLLYVTFDKFYGAYVHANQGVAIKNGVVVDVPKQKQIPQMEK